MRLESTVTCPQCGCAKTLAMPLDACLVVYECSACGARLTPKEGDCCVFCSYGDVPCPPVQTEAHCCETPARNSKTAMDGNRE